MGKMTEFTEQLSTTELDFKNMYFFFKIRSNNATYFLGQNQLFSPVDLPGDMLEAFLPDRNCTVPTFCDQALLPHRDTAK